MMKRASSQEKCSSCKPQQTRSSRFGGREFSIRAGESDISSEPICSLPGFNLMDLPLHPPVQEKMSGLADLEYKSKVNWAVGMQQPEVMQRQADPELEEDEDEDEVLQGKFESSEVAAKPEQAEPRPNRTGMPDRLKAGIESLSGIDMSDVRLHANSDKPARLNALAYTQGNQIFLGPGQEKHLPHEAWHAVQQKQGRVRATSHVNGLGINKNQNLKQEAELIGQKIDQTQIKTMAGFRGLIGHHIIHPSSSMGFHSIVAQLMKRRASEDNEENEEDELTQKQPRKEKEELASHTLTSSISASQPLMHSATEQAPPVRMQMTQPQVAAASTTQSVPFVGRKEGSFTLKIKGTEADIWYTDDGKYHFTFYRESRDYHVKGNKSSFKPFQKGYFGGKFEERSQAENGKKASEIAIGRGRELFDEAEQRIIPLYTQLFQRQSPCT